MQHKILSADLSSTVQTPRFDNVVLANEWQSFLVTEKNPLEISIGQNTELIIVRQNGELYIVRSADSLETGRRHVLAEHAVVNIGRNYDSYRFRIGQSISSVWSDNNVSRSHFDITWRRVGDHCIVEIFDNSKYGTKVQGLIVEKPLRSFRTIHSGDRLPIQIGQTMGLRFDRGSFSRFPLYFYLLRSEESIINSMRKNYKFSTNFGSKQTSNTEITSTILDLLDDWLLNQHFNQHYSAPFFKIEMQEGMPVLHFLREATLVDPFFVEIVAF